MRVQKLKKLQNSQNKKWASVMNKEQNYIMYKKGYKHMLEDIEYAKTNISKFKRGLSVFEDK